MQASLQRPHFSTFRYFCCCQLNSFQHTEVILKPSAHNWTKPCKWGLHRTVSNRIITSLTLVYNPLSNFVQYWAFYLRQSFVFNSWLAYGMCVQPIRPIVCLCLRKKNWRGSSNTSLWKVMNLKALEMRARIRHHNLLQQGQEMKLVREQAVRAVSRPELKAQGRRRGVSRPEARPGRRRSRAEVVWKPLWLWEQLTGSLDENPWDGLIQSPQFQPSLMLDFCQAKWAWGRPVPGGHHIGSHLQEKPSFLHCWLSSYKKYSFLVRIYHTFSFSFILWFLSQFLSQTCQTVTKQLYLWLCS